MNTFNLIEFFKFWYFFAKFEMVFLDICRLLVTLNTNRCRVQNEWEKKSEGISRSCILIDIDNYYHNTYIIMWTNCIKFRGLQYIIFV